MPLVVHVEMVIDLMVFHISDETRDVDGCQRSPFFLRPTGSQIRGTNSMGVIANPAQVRLFRRAPMGVGLRDTSGAIVRAC